MQARSRQSKLGSNCFSMLDFILIAQLEFYKAAMSKLAVFNMHARLV